MSKSPRQVLGPFNCTRQVMVRAKKTSITLVDITHADIVRVNKNKVNINIH